MSDGAPSDAYAAWQRLVDSLAAAGRRMDEASAVLSAEERADGFRSRARSRTRSAVWKSTTPSPSSRPSTPGARSSTWTIPTACNWVAEIAPTGRYRIDGVARGAIFTSVNVYAGAGLEAPPSSRVTSTARADAARHQAPRIPRATRDERVMDRSSAVEQDRIRERA